MSPRKWSVLHMQFTIQICHTSHVGSIMLNQITATIIQSVESHKHGTMDAIMTLFILNRGYVMEKNECDGYFNTITCDTPTASPTMQPVTLSPTDSTRNPTHPTTTASALVSESPTATISTESDTTMDQQPTSCFSVNILIVNT
eukprot:920364_1